MQVFDAIEENGTVYLVMERLEGRTLGEEIDSLGALEPKFVESLGLKICEALNIVHQAGLLHRDLKPDNVFLTKDARIVLIDFGSAREFRDSKTVRYTRMVTPGYAPLEQYAEAAILGPYTDIYGLGATLFHAITGKLPPSATDRVLGSQLQLSAVISKTVRNAIEQAMQVKVTDRPSSVEAMVRLLIGQIPAAPLPIMKSISSWAFLKSELIKPLQLHLTNLSIQDRKEQLRILQSNISLRLDVAESLQTDSQTLATLAHDKRSDRVRILVSKNLNTSISTLQFLLKDENPIVAQFAKANLVLRN